ncbi:hypothetical protein MPSEU_000822100 [Mayamaea pseudoterrestris]|nr:hypothetical protein MPSEU_000822100 [Mayamaea pseudoterrestris]
MMATDPLRQDKVLSAREMYEDDTEDILCGRADDSDSIEEDQRDPAAPGKVLRPQEARSESETSFVNVLKDFFRSTFSDHYPTESYCCTGSELMKVVPDAYCCKGQTNQRIASKPYESNVIPSDTNQLNSNQYSNPQGSGSALDRIAQTPPQRKKALAVATGFKYAADMDGRTVVIVPGTRRSPIDLTSYAAIAHLRQYGATRQHPAVGLSTTTTTTRITRLPASETPTAEKAVIVPANQTIT